ncbi:MAG: DUF4397 domain-containing protein [Bacteroidota bacterium]
MNILLKIVFPVFCCAFFLSSCDEDVLQAPLKTANVQFVNLDSAIKNMTVSAGGVDVLPSLPFGEFSGYKNVSAGSSQEIKVFANGKSVGLPTRYTFGEGGYYTILLYGTAARLDYLPLVDSLRIAPAAGKAKIRFVHFANSVAGAGVFLKVGDSLQSVFPIFYPSEIASQYAEIPQGIQTIVIKDIILETIAGQIENFNFENGKSYTLYTFDDIQSSGGGLKIKITEHPKL